MSEREKFRELLLELAGMPEESFEKLYPDDDVNMCWAVFKASRRTALEEAANICDEKQDWYEKDNCRGQAVATAACADEIRTLANGDKQ